jgi:hypothetical protein
MEEYRNQGAGYRGQGAEGTRERVRGTGYRKQGTGFRGQGELESVKEKQKAVRHGKIADFYNTYKL